MDIKLNAEQRLSATEDIYLAYLAYLVKSNIGKASDDPRFNVSLDEALIDRINDGTAPIAYWFTAKYIATHFDEFKQLLRDIFKLLDIHQFDEARFTETRLIETLTANSEMLRNLAGNHVYEFTMFIIDNLESV